MFHKLARAPGGVQWPAFSNAAEFERPSPTGLSWRESLLAHEELSIGRQLLLKGAGLQAVEHAPPTLIDAISICDHKAFGQKDSDMRVDLPVVNF